MQPLRSLLAVSLFALTAAIPPAAVAADDAPAVEGSWSMSGRAYTLKYAAAYETEVGGDPGIAIVVSTSPINLQEIKKAIAEETTGELWFRQPHIKVLFEKSGEISSFYATAGSFTTNGNKGLTGDLKLDGGRVTGRAVLESQGEGTLQRSFDFRFATGLVGSGAEPAPQVAALMKLGVSGTFQGNGKDTKLAFVSAREVEPFDDKPCVEIVFTERDHSRDPKPSLKASFGQYGSALIISCEDDGNIYSCQVAHAAHAKKPFSTSGTLSMGDFQVAGDQVQGKLTSSGEQEFFDQTWEIDLQFAAPFAGFAKRKEVAQSAPTRPTAPAAAVPVPTSPADRPAAPPAGETLKVRDLAIVQGVSNVQYKSIVEQLTFESTTDYRTLAGEIDKKLAAQGWTKDGGDLVGASAILRRKRGEASLTIFVKPAAGGSTVTVMTEGLSWE